MTDKNTQETEITTEAMPTSSMADFLEGCPPNQTIKIPDLIIRKRFEGGYTSTAIHTPELQLHCTDSACNGDRFFRCITKPISPQDESWQYIYLTYKCSNCLKVIKVFSIASCKDNGETSGKCYKFGELPTFGPPTPARLIKLIGPDRELFLKGRRCENQGLGIGAFVYYRRVVEDQKNRIIKEIIRVAEKLGASAQALAELEAAIQETQFSKALESVKHGIPQALLINGHNPLLLLHSALSDGVHEKTDEECLELASNIRIVLVELADRLSQALKDEAELNNAVNKLASIKSKKG